MEKDPDQKQKNSFQLYKLLQYNPTLLPLQPINYNVPIF